ncbi:MAG: hypothetical protein IJR33_08575 [Clostridia bacterium]|nr:hypothetical protein [Clostridia bacterium]
MLNPTKWALQVKKLYNDDNPKCPVCKGTITGKYHRYEDGYGYLQMCCNDCKAQIVFNRVKIPHNISKKVIEL